ncbi:MAG: OmpA family protein [Deltaproteobacteria bacterium]
MKKIIFSLLLLLLASGCDRFAKPIAPAIDPASPSAVKVYVIRDRGVFAGNQPADNSWVVGIDDRALCRLKPGEYAVLDTTAGDAHWVKVKHLLAWWHESKESFVAEPNTDYYFLIGVQDNHLNLEKIDATAAAVYIRDSTRVGRPPQPVQHVVAAPEPTPEVAPPPPMPEEEPVAQAPSEAEPEPKPEPKKPEPTGALVQEIYFEFNKAEIKPDMYDDLDAAVQYLQQHPAASVALGGHASEEGTEKYNLDLSERRANAVRAYLEKAGIKADRIIEEAFGEANPKYDNTTEEGRRLNRRVNFKLVDGS